MLRHCERNKEQSERVTHACDLGGSQENNTNPFFFKILENKRSVQSISKAAAYSADSGGGVGSIRLIHSAAAHRGRSWHLLHRNNSASVPGKPDNSGG